ncbi:MAG: pyrroline-5-carboxylate reductase [Gammaproteobacteria bacterium]|jgi:pyrroline-5-carboxylate reductase|nr:pyrroline-5-carboxylate reductase [Gammaproteobacteria bacterium]MBT7603812.1 pyrroline-5-carboxylate reductase [Gammaproteobacteria bacterium]
MKIAFIGYGNMSIAIIDGILESKNNNFLDNIYIFHNKENLHSKKEGCKYYLSGNNQSKENFDIVFLAVKPKDINNAIRENINIFKDEQIIISIVAGINVKTIKSIINRNNSIIRAMPNLCAKIKKSTSIIFYYNNLNNNLKKSIESLFSCIGSIIIITDEEQLHSYTALTGSGPAYVMYFIEAMYEACENFNIDDSLKFKVILDMAIGTLDLIEKKSKGIEDIKKMRNEVTSKGGTTEAAIKSLSDNSFSKILRDAVNEAKIKSIDLSIKD